MTFLSKKNILFYTKGHTVSTSAITSDYSTLLEVIVNSAFETT